MERKITRREFLRVSGTLTSVFLFPGFHFKALTREEDFIVGGLINDYIARRIWGPFWKSVNPLEVLHDNGFRWVATWVLTKSSSFLRDTPPERWQTLPWRDEYWASLEYVTQFLKEAQAVGHRLHLLLAMSNEHPYPCHQIIPPEWRGLSDNELANALEKYCFNTAKHFVDNGLNIEIYSMGNEIEFGILNTLPGQSCVPPGVDVFTDLDFLRRNIWPHEASLLKAAIRGVKQANPTAKIALHPNSVGRSINNQHLRAFLTAMVQGGVEFDYVSFSNPTTWSVLVEGTRPYYRSIQFQSLINFVASLRKKVLIGEFLYPHSSARIDAPPDPGYPYSPSGQAKWVRDFLSFSVNNDTIVGVFYWYPEYFPGYSMDLKLSADYTGLFASETQIQPAMKEFRRFL